MEEGVVSFDLEVMVFVLLVDGEHWGLKLGPVGDLLRLTHQHRIVMGLVDLAKVRVYSVLFWRLDEVVRASSHVKDHSLRVLHLRSMLDVLSAEMRL